MWWNTDEIHTAYAAVHEGSINGGCTVLLLVAQDCDALCACQILTSLFRSDNISYKIKPVSGYDDIRAAYEDLVKDNADMR